jgi:hypothetical protein
MREGEKDMFILRAMFWYPVLLILYIIEAISKLFRGPETEYIFVKEVILPCSKEEEKPPYQEPDDYILGLS